jgi:hypothetical protein
MSFFKFDYSLPLLCHIYRFGVITNRTGGTTIFFSVGEDQPLTAGWHTTDRVCFKSDKVGLLRTYYFGFILKAITLQFVP